MNVLVILGGVRITFGILRLLAIKELIKELDVQMYLMIT